MLVFCRRAKGLFGSPDRDWLGVIVARRLFEEITFGNALPEIETARDKLQGWTAAMSEGLSDEGFVAVRDDHTRLFVGPRALLAPPWESVYTNTDGAVCRREKVRGTKETGERRIGERGVGPG